jgi:hypothetical protein
MRANPKKERERERTGAAIEGLIGGYLDIGGPVALSDDPVREDEEHKVPLWLPGSVRSRLPCRFAYDELERRRRRELHRL